MLVLVFLCSCHESSARVRPARHRTQDGRGHSGICHYSKLELLNRLLLEGDKGRRGGE